MKLNLIGQKYNRLTVIQKSTAVHKSDAVSWDCICDCGKQTTATSYELRSGHKKSCGCLKQAPKHEDLTGRRFGRLTVIKHMGNDTARKTIWRCKCDCGKNSDVRAPDLKSGNTQSCGCLGQNLAKRNLMKGGFYGKNNFETARQEGTPSECRRISKGKWDV